MKLLIFILLSVLACIAGAWENYYDGFIINFIWPQDSEDLPRFSSEQRVVLSYSYFENFTHAIGDQLKNVKELEFYGGTVLQVQLKKNIEQLQISKSKTKNIEIDLKEEYAIVKLTVQHCEISSIPKNVNRLRRLKTLYLNYNKIEHVQMTDFNGLNNLEEIWLHGNGMKTLSSESTIHLPKLSRLDLDENNLREINVCSWDMPTLEEFYLNNNKLKFVVNLVDQLPKLNKFSISENPLVCQWKDNLVRSLKSKTIELWYGEATCNATDETHVPTECPTVYSLSNQLSGILERQRSSEQSMGISTKKIESLEQMVKKSTEESKTFRQSMETFKQHSLGKQNVLNQTVKTLNDQFQSMAKKSNEEIQSLTDQLTKSSTEIVTVQQMVKKSNEENQSLKQTVEMLTDQLVKSSKEIVSLQQIAKKSNDENQSLKKTVTTINDQFQRMEKKSNDEIQSLKQAVTTLTDQHQRMEKKLTEEIQSLTDQLTNSSTEIVSLQQMAKKSSEENQSLNQTVTTLTDQLQRMTNKSNEEIQLLTDQLTKLHHSIDDLTEGFYRYVLEKEGGEK